MVPVASTVNNIVINNFNAAPGGVAQQDSSMALNAPAFKPSKLYFPPLEEVSQAKPTVEQEAELAQATQLAGGVRPLHQRDPPKQVEATTAIEKKEKVEEKDKKPQFNFPDGGWECNKCQNYNFKGRKECYRCKKAKTDLDVEGKPEHMSQPKKTKK